MVLTRAQAKANAQRKHLPLEIWLTIVSFIAAEDRPHAWFSLRSLCHTSKDAVEYVYTRFFLRHMLIVVVTPRPETLVYMADGVSGGAAYFLARRRGLHQDKQQRSLCLQSSPGNTVYRLPLAHTKTLAAPIKACASNSNILHGSCHDLLPWSPLLTRLLGTETGLAEASACRLGLPKVFVAFYLPPYTSERYWDDAVRGRTGAFDMKRSISPALMCGSLVDAVQRYPQLYAIYQARKAEIDDGKRPKGRRRKQPRSGKSCPLLKPRKKVYSEPL